MKDFERSPANRKGSNTVLGIGYFSIAFEALGILLSLFTLIEIFKRGRNISENQRKGFIYPWIVWCFLFTVLNIIFLACLIVFASSFDLLYLLGFMLNTLFRTFCGFVGSGYFQWLNNMDGENEEEENI